MPPIKQIAIYTILGALLILTNSCNYFINPPKSQLYYQKYASYNILDSCTIIKFNPLVLKSKLDTTNKKYIIIGHCNTHCIYVYKKFQLSKSICNDNKDSVYFIPLIHDYLYNIKSSILNHENYNPQNEIFITDVKYYRKGLNPNQNYDKQFISTFDSTFTSDTFNRDISFYYKNKIVLIQNTNIIEKNQTLQTLINKSRKIKSPIWLFY